jgi:hypothetical protein
MMSLLGSRFQQTIISKAAEANGNDQPFRPAGIDGKQMPLIINELHRRRLNIPVLVGGAAINRRFDVGSCLQKAAKLTNGVFITGCV